MHPALSLIFFTVLSGLGLGMIACLGLGFGPDTGWFGPTASFTAFSIAVGGGLVSSKHLANSKNAWRAFSQWRSSWLSREACLLVATLGIFALYAGYWVLTGDRWWVLGWITAVLALTTVYATAMIYAQLRTVPMWSLAPTPALFLGLSLTGGVLASRMFQGILGDGEGLWHAALALVAGAGLSVWWTTIAAGAGRTSTGSTIESATGLEGSVRQFEGPHTGRNYLLDEMAFRIGRKRAFALRLNGAVVGFVIPFVFAALAPIVSPWLLPPALLLHVVGVAALRWLFFAEAEHVQALYYGMK